jgi:hypothetical protein
MEHYGKVALMVLGAWAVLAFVGVAPAVPGSKKHKRNSARNTTRGSVWAVPVVSAPSGEDNVSFPQANVL